MDRRALSDGRHADVVVVGAGLAGLTAARVLVAHGVDVHVLEARDRVGGRAYTTHWGDGTSIDLGAQWIGPGQERIAALAASLGMATFPAYDEGATIFLVRTPQAPEGLRIAHTSAIPARDSAVGAAILAAIEALDILARDVPLEAPWAAPRAREWDAQTFESWIVANVPVAVARAWLRIECAAIFSAEPHELSLLHALFYSHAAGGWRPLVDVLTGAQERRFHGGAQEVANRMARQLGSRVVLNAPVNTIAQDAHGVQVVSDGGVVTARRVIVAIPPALAGRIRYRPALSGHRDQLTQRMPMGAMVKVHCIYDTAFWRTHGLSGQATSNTGPVGTTFDNSPEGGTPGVLVGFIAGDAARYWSGWPYEKRRAAVLADLVRYFGADAAHPRMYSEQSWADEEYSRGGYAGYMPPGVWTSCGEDMRVPIGRIHWAGTETATVWNGYMDGAVSSGERAAVEVIMACGASWDSDLVSPVVAGLSPRLVTPAAPTLHSVGRKGDDMKYSNDSHAVITVSVEHVGDRDDLIDPVTVSKG